MKKVLIINPLFPELFLEEAKIALPEFAFELFTFGESEIKKNSFLDKILNIVYHNILKNKNYYLSKKAKARKKNLLIAAKKLENKHFDIAFITRADRFPEVFIKKIRKVSTEFINYQCDGMEVSPELFKIKNYFDRNFTFEKDDIKNYPDLNFLSVTNFYFKRNVPPVDNSQMRIYYLGVGIPQRIEMLKNINASALKSENRFLISAEQDFSDAPFYFFSKHISYNENIKNVLDANVIIDLKLPYHNGLSFRFFESIGYDRKLITNNATVLRYEFYHPNNIFVTDFINFEGLEAFLKKPYQPLNKKTKDKYAFENWLKYILNIESHQSINF